MEKSNIECVCERCGKNYIYHRTSGHTYKKCNSCMANQHRKRNKSLLIEYAGGGCQTCGYNKCNSALVFHHLDPTKKEFTISGWHGRSMLALKKEVDKCILLCHNCHAEEHERLIEIKKRDSSKV